MGDYQDYNEDVQRIKSAILQSQYETGRVANSNQLALYYGIGGYVSANTRSGKGGSGALASISDQPQKELPGLRGFSERNLKYMRTFFEEWQPLFGVTITCGAVIAVNQTLGRKPLTCHDLHNRA